MVLSSVAGERRKQLGSFYTPPELVDALTTWAIRRASDRVLEPASGEAAFLLAAVRRLRELGAGDPSRQMLGNEIDEEALRSTRELLDKAGEEVELLHGDFFDLTPEETGPFTVALGNPPYVRYHRFRGDARLRGLTAAAAAGVELTGLASSWAPFVVHASRFLVPEGRLAFVLPAELLSVDYARAVRDFLVRRFGSVTIVTFAKSVFPGAMIDTVLLMAEGGNARGVRIIRLKDAAELRDLAGTEPYGLAPTGRWSSLLTPPAGAGVLDRLRSRGLLRRLGDVATVDIGFVTGANDFFMLTREEARARGLPARVLQPAIGRPGQLRGAVLTELEGNELRRSERCLVLKLAAPGLDQRNTPVGRYLRRGTRLGVHRGYKCAGRSPWYAIPGIRVPDAFMSYMSNVAPRVVLNEAGFSSSNLVHQINFHLTERSDARAFIAALHSSIAMLSFEIEGRSYGGGVLKHETREAERVELPFSLAISGALADALPHVDAALRAAGPSHAAEIVDDILVRENVLGRDELEAVRDARHQLHERRTTRGRTSA